MDKFWDRHILFELVRISGDSVSTVMEFEHFWNAGKRWYLEFSVQAARSESAPTGEARVYNMHPNTVARVKKIIQSAKSQADGLALRIYAGWGPAKPPLVFFGIVTDFFSEWQRNELISTFQLVAGDDSWLFFKCAPNSSWKPGTPKTQVILDLLKQLEARNIPTYHSFEGRNIGIYSSGKAFESGKLIRDALAEIANEKDVACDVFFSPYDGTVYFIPWEYVVERVRISPQDWLVGVPRELREKNVSGWDFGPGAEGASEEELAQESLEKKFEVTCFLNPRIQPQSGVSISSRLWDPNYAAEQTREFVVESVEHVADRHRYYTIAKLRVPEPEGR